MAENSETTIAEASAASLLSGRNPNLGNLFLAERAVFYLDILYRLLVFRREHELEPLYEDIYDAVRNCQEDLYPDSVYALDSFRQDMEQLKEWQLLDERMEIERLRGYRDTRKRKFRYSLVDDALALLEWFEERAQADLEGPEEDTRDVLEEVCGVLNQLLRLLHNCGTKRARDDDPRRILYQLFRLDELTLQANRHLATFNARLLGFVLRGYDLGEAQGILPELEDFVDQFLRQVHELRSEVTDGISKLLLSRNQERLAQCAQTMEIERRRTPHLLRRTQDYQAQARIPFVLAQFYQDGGKLDQVCRRINSSAMRVWRKLHAHLRELQRRNNRVEDLRARTSEMAQLPANTVPYLFLRELAASAHVPLDPNYWDDSVKATAPEPRIASPTARTERVLPIRPKKRGRGPAVSMDEERLRELREWAFRMFGLGAAAANTGTPLSWGAFETDDDAARLMELAKSGLLAEGTRLNRVDLALSRGEEDVEVLFAEARLRFQELFLHRQSTTGTR